MTRWEEFDFEERIRLILSDSTYRRPNHHLGRPFLTPYQIAIEFERRFPEDFRKIGLPIGGKGTQNHESLSQYIALTLSRNMQSDKLPDFEGGFLSNNHLSELSFDWNGTKIESSLTDTQNDVSIFRLKDKA